MIHALFLRLACVASGLFALTSTSAARADQPPLALDRFQPAAAGDALFGVDSPSVSKGKIAFSALGSYAHDPLVVTGGNDHGVVLDRVVREQLLLHIGLAVELGGRLKLDVDMPFTVAQSGTGATIAGHTLAVPTGGDYGDTRLGARISLLPQDGAIPGAAIAFRLYLPSGAGDQYSGAGSARYAPSLIVGASFPTWLWSAQLGRTFMPARSTFPEIVGSDVFLSAGVAAIVDRVQIGPEIYASTVADAASNSFSRTTSSIEALIGAKYQTSDVIFGLAGGPGISVGVGTPTYRVLFGITYAPSVSGSKRDTKPVSDENANANSAHANTSSPTNHVADVLDTDGDTVPDDVDACPRVPGDPKGKRPGCPSDRDSDGIIDAEDACPDAVGPRTNDPKTNGCPADTDGDGIIDTEDACPKEKGPKTSDPKTNGCPTSVRIEGQQIVIMQQVQFENGLAVLKPESSALLDQIADVMRAHPELARVAVDGHTDSRGQPAKNVALSQARAVAVVRYLTEHGVDARRLESRAFGPRQPIADNNTDAGRAKNRRVEFQIRKRTTEGEAGWVDGPVK